MGSQCFALFSSFHRRVIRDEFNVRRAYGVASEFVACLSIHTRSPGRGGGNVPPACPQLAVFALTVLARWGRCLQPTSYFAASQCSAGLPKARVHVREGPCFQGFRASQPHCSCWKQMCVFFGLSLKSERHMLLVTVSRRLQRNGAWPCGPSFLGTCLKPRAPSPSFPGGQRPGVPYGQCCWLD